MYRCGKARSRAVIKALTLGKRWDLLSSFDKAPSTGQSNIVTCLVAAGKKNDWVFDCLIAGVYLQAIVLGDRDQSCVCVRWGVRVCVWIVCVWRGVKLFVQIHQQQRS